MEMIDIYDDNLQLIGSVDREKAHIDGSWHKTFHCWFINEKEPVAVLFQYRSPNKKTHPDKLDVSAAGHLMSGESIEDGIREVEEELGVKVNYRDTKDFGYRLSTSCRKGLVNREIQLIHMLKINIELCNFRPQKDEVSGLFWIPITDGIKLFNNDLQSIIVNGIVYNENEDKWENSKMEVNYDKFVPKAGKYYLSIFLTARRLLDNEYPLVLY